MNSNLDNNVGYDYQTTVNSYYCRDIQLNLNNNETILKCLVKLGFYNVDVETETKNISLDLLLKKIRDELKSNWGSEIKNKTLDELLSDHSRVLSDRRYIHIMNRYNRSVELSGYVNSCDTFDFYNSLTLEELNYLGY